MHKKQEHRDVGQSCCGTASAERSQAARPEDTSRACCEPIAAAAPTDAEKVVQRVRESYAAIARRQQASCCGTSPASRGCGLPRQQALKLGYSAGDLDAAPADANLGLGCGAPVGHLDLEAGEVVVDLGSGAGIDAFVAAQRVGPAGKVIGIDMTPEMIELACKNAASGGWSNVEFRQGRLEQLPLDDGSADAVTSNCVINLVPDKERVFREIARVLKPGGRLVIADIVLERPLPEAIRDDVRAYVGCVAGAAERASYFKALADAGFTEVEVLRETDVVELFGGEQPAEIAAVLARAGLQPKDLRGVASSITFRARRC